MTDAIYKNSVTPSLVPGSPEALLAEANHRIANNLARVISIVRLQASHIAKSTKNMSCKEVSELMGEVASRIEAVGRLHNILSRGGREANVDVSDYLEDVCQSLLSSLTATRKVQLSHNFEQGCFLPAGQLVLVGLIVTELIMNAVKYAHPTGVPTWINVDCRRTADGRLVVEVADDGVGLPEGFDSNGDGGLGFRVMRALAEQLGGTLLFQSGALGLCVRLVIAATQANGALHSRPSGIAAVQ